MPNAAVTARHTNERQATMPEAQFHIRPVGAHEDLAATIGLFRAYAAALSVDLAYQDFEGELAALPGKYAPPAGALLLARGAEGAPLGCVAMRAMEPGDCCEMKRLYVSPDARGMGLGKALVEAVIEAARRAGYRELRLDTLPEMADAQALYARLGFGRIAPYYDTPVAGTVFMGCAL
jgi:ribosomal protein S18 acetylase RimI-like enzyme